MYLSYSLVALIPAFENFILNPQRHGIQTRQHVIGAQSIENRLFQAILNMLLHSTHSLHSLPNQLSGKVVEVDVVVLYADFN